MGGNYRLGGFKTYPLLQLAAPVTGRGDPIEVSDFGAEYSAQGESPLESAILA